MRRTSPSNRIARYFREPQTPTYVVTPPAWRPAARLPSRDIPLVHRLGGPTAGITACLLQLAASTLCIAGAISAWLGHPIDLSPTTLVLLGGVVLGASSGLLLYSFLVSAAVASATTQDAD